MPFNYILICCSISHRNSTLEQREPLQIAHEEMARANSLLNGYNGIMESAIISTCNRVELYMLLGKEYDPFEISKDFFMELKGIDITELQNYFSIKKERHAVYQLLRVASGIDSMVLGENQIVGQMREAYSSACAVRSAGKIMHRLFHQAFRTGKRVRSDTEMGKGSCSVSTAAVSVLRQTVEAIEKKKILFIGVNQMIKMASSRLKKLHVTDFIYVNRTIEKAESFAHLFGGKGYSLDKLSELISEVDVIISCTGSQEPIITKQMLKAINRKLIIVDLAIPRDVEAVNGEYNHIEIYDLDKIKGFVNEQQHKREAAIPDAEVIIERKLKEFIYWYDHVRNEPITSGNGHQFEAIRLEVFENLIEQLPDEYKVRIEDASKRLVKRLAELKTRKCTKTNCPK